MSNDLEELADYSLGMFSSHSSMTHAHATEDEVPDHEMVRAVLSSNTLTSQESVSGQAEQETDPDLDDLPTDNELRLAQRVLELEHERDGLAVRNPSRPRPTNNRTDSVTWRRSIPRTAPPSPSPKAAQHRFTYRPTSSPYSPCSVTTSRS